MLNTTKLVFFTLCGALLAGASSPSHASNVYNAALSQPATNPVYSCPAEVLSIFAKADDQGTRTDATVSDMPEHHTWSLEYDSRYYDYSRLIMGD